MPIKLMKIKIPNKRLTETKWEKFKINERYEVFNFEMGTVFLRMKMFYLLRFYL